MKIRLVKLEIKIFTFLTCLAYYTSVCLLTTGGRGGGVVNRATQLNLDGSWAEFGNTLPKLIVE